MSYYVSLLKICHVHYGRQFSPSFTKVTSLKEKVLNIYYYYQNECDKISGMVTFFIARTILHNEAVTHVAGVV